MSSMREKLAALAQKRKAEKEIDEPRTKSKSKPKASVSSPPTRPTSKPSSSSSSRPASRPSNSKPPGLSGSYSKSSSVAKTHMSKPKYASNDAAPRSRFTREDEYDLDDGFVVDDDELEEELDSDEGDSDELSEEEVRPKKKSKSKSSSKDSSKKKKSRRDDSESDESDGNLSFDEDDEDDLEDELDCIDKSNIIQGGRGRRTRSSY